MIETTATTAKKGRHLRHAEYYGLTEVSDELYAKSKAQAVFTDLMPLILSEENILLAYRNIKRNTGSRTAGVDHLTMKHIEKLSSEDVISKVRHKLAWYVSVNKDVPTTIRSEDIFIYGSVMRAYQFGCHRELSRVTPL